MKLCETHWTGLKAALTARGLDRFIAATGEQMMARTQIDDGAPMAGKRSFEPLLGGLMALTGNLLECLGPELVQADAANGNVCPLCWGNEDHTKRCTEVGCTFTFDTWVSNAADDQLEIAKSIGLVAVS